MGQEEKEAQEILSTAINHNKASDLINCLYNGGGCMVDEDTGELILIVLPILSEE